MLDFTFMLWVELLVERIHSQGNKFAMGEANKGTVYCKPNDSPVKLELVHYMQRILEAKISEV